MTRELENFFARLANDMPRLNAMAEASRIAPIEPPQSRDNAMRRPLFEVAGAELPSNAMACAKSNPPWVDFVDPSPRSVGDVLRQGSGSPRKLTPDQEIAWANTALHPEDEYATDSDGTRLYKWDAGKLTATGWDVDHIIPQAFGGTDAPHNLRARYWRNNRLASSLLSAVFFK